MPAEGNTRLVYAAKQSAKGTPAAAPTHRLMVSGDAALDPNREIIQLPETDASAQRSDSRVVGASPGGGWSGWMRASEFAFLAEGIMGVNADAGTSPNFTHTATPSKVLPYYTLWDVIPSLQTTRFDDCRFSQLGASGEALQGIPYTAQALALSATLGVTEPVAPAASATDLSYAYPLVKVTIGGVYPGTHDAWTIEINRNVTYLRGDMGLAIFDSHPGLFEVSGTFRKIYTTDADYRKIHGGAAAATVLTTTIFSESLDLLIEENANRSVKFLSSAIEYTAITVPVNVDGSPILQTISFNTKRQATWSNNLSIITKNAHATPATSPT